MIHAPSLEGGLGWVKQEATTVLLKLNTYSHKERSYLDAEDADDDNLALTIPNDLGSITFTNDANGNMIEELYPVDGNTYYEFNHKNQLVGVTLPDNTYVTYRYDSFGKRREKKVCADNTCASVTTWKRYLYNGSSIIIEYDVDPVTEALSVAAEYIHDAGMDNQVAMIRHEGAASSTYYYHKDGLGSIIDISDETGNVVKSYTYKTFGTIAGVTGDIIPATGELLENPYTYTGREYDAETGLYYYRARYYNPMLGRFINKDPIGIAGGLNMFTYVGNNPVNATDPSGLLREIVITVYSSMVGGAVTWTYPYDNDKRYVIPLYKLTVEWGTADKFSVPGSVAEVMVYFRTKDIHEFPDDGIFNSFPTGNDQLNYIRSFEYETFAVNQNLTENKDMFSAPQTVYRAYVKESTGRTTGDYMIITGHELGHTIGVGMHNAYPDSIMYKNLDISDDATFLLEDIDQMMIKTGYDCDQ